MAQDAAIAEWLPVGSRPANEMTGMYFAIVYQVSVIDVHTSRNYCAIHLLNLTELIEVRDHLEVAHLMRR
jgi:hypothetical protein